MIEVEIDVDAHAANTKLFREPDFRQQHAGKWVACTSGAVIATGTEDEVFDAAEAQDPAKTLIDFMQVDQ